MNDEQRAKLIKLSHTYAYMASLLARSTDSSLDDDQANYDRAREAFEDCVAKS